MNKHVMPQLNRRAFVIGTAAVGAGLSLGLDIPFGGPTVVRAADGSPEINAWVVIRPDDTVVIRIARSEMGQGSLTGLAQLVAEELECDWSKVTTDAGPKCRSQARVGRFLDRRQPRHPRQPGICPQGRRHGTRDAGPGCGQRMEGAGIGMRGSQ
jgi:CO/xanthine dehydrogenase Mo-binding subunit